MIKTIWYSGTATKPNDPTPIGKLIITNDGAEQGILPVQIDLAVAQNLGNYASLEFQLLTNGVAPAANQSVTAWAAFCSSSSKTPVELSTAAASQVFPLAQVPNTRRIYMMPLFYMGARWLYIWFDHTALPAGATVEILISVNAQLGTL